MAYYVKELCDFLTELSRNNDRAWFKVRKDRYDALRKLWLDDLGLMIGAMAEWDSSLASVEPRKAAYRIYRDTRFSPDKTPYKTFFSAAINPPSAGRDGAGYYLQIGPDFNRWTGLFAGIWCPEASVLKRLRRDIVDNIEEWEEILAVPEVARNFEITCSDSLKTVPKGYDRNHPLARWLRMKDYGLEATVDPKFFFDPSWPEKSAELLSYTKPFVDFLNYSINESDD